MSGAEERSRAPYVVFGCMIATALVALTIILVYDCRRTQPYLDPEPIRQGDPGRVPPPPPKASSAP